MTLVYRTGKCLLMVIGKELRWHSRWGNPLVFLCIASFDQRGQRLLHSFKLADPLIDVRHFGQGAFAELRAFGRGIKFQRQQLPHFAQRKAQALRLLDETEAGDGVRFELPVTRLPPRRLLQQSSRS